MLICDSSVKADMTVECLEMSMKEGSVDRSCFPLSGTRALFEQRLPPCHPPSLCVARCETDGEGKDDHQTEGRRE